MPQDDMTWETFVSLSDNLPPGSYVILQGEGEPTLHTRFWDMAEYLTNAGHYIETTLNGTQLDTVLIPKYFKTLGISVDSLDEEFCNSIGRINLPKVLRNIDKLIEVFPANNITIRTVDMGQPQALLKQWVATNGLRLSSQPLQTKPDYSSNYAIKMQVMPFIPVKPTKRTSLCSYLIKDRLRYYTVSGVELPCCFIKNTTDITTIENMKHCMPQSCIGCDK